MPRGRCKWYSDDKGYGFLTMQEAGTFKDVFVHVSQLKEVGILIHGDEVDFDLMTTPRGPTAHNVKRVDPV
jgi:CspA family cold shock protein